MFGDHDTEKSFLGYTEPDQSLMGLLCLWQYMIGISFSEGEGSQWFQMPAMDKYTPTPETNWVIYSVEEKQDWPDTIHQAGNMGCKWMVHLVKEKQPSLETDRKTIAINIGIIFGIMELCKMI